MKTEIYNLIILDESGSMNGVARQTIDGCNETINTIISSQEKFADTQTHFVSIFAFQSNDKIPSRYLVRNVPAHNVKHITSDDYKPWGATPLYDAIGTTLVDLKSITNEKELAIGSVTIITDGYENASEIYTLPKIVAMIDQLKEMGWNFNFIGANIDVEQTSKHLHIDNALAFEQDAEGTKAMFARERFSRMAYNKRINDAFSCNCCEASPSLSKEEVEEHFKKASKDYFNNI